MCCSFQQIFAFNIVRVGGPNISFICILSKWSFPSCCPCYKLSCWYTLRQTINFRPKILVSISDSESLSPSLNISVSNSQCLILRVSVSVWESKSRYLSLRVSLFQYIRNSVPQSFSSSVSQNFWMKNRYLSQCDDTAALKSRNLLSQTPSGKRIHFACFHKLSSLVDFGTHTSIFIGLTTTRTTRGRALLLC